MHGSLIGEEEISNRSPNLSLLFSPSLSNQTKAALVAPVQINIPPRLGKGEKSQHPDMWVTGKDVLMGQCKPLNSALPPQQS